LELSPADDRCERDGRLPSAGTYDAADVQRVLDLDLDVFVQAAVS
jgi:hypothetical protein